MTKGLETEIRSSRQVVVTSDTTFDTTQPLTGVIFICHADLDTPAIVAYLPQLIALYKGLMATRSRAALETRVLVVLDLVPLVTFVLLMTTLKALTSAVSSSSS